MPVAIDRCFSFPLPNCLSRMRQDILLAKESKQLAESQFTRFGESESRHLVSAVAFLGGRVLFSEMTGRR